MKEALRNKMVCPLCRTPLTDVKKSLTCSKCNMTYHYLDGIPNFLPDELMLKYNKELKLQDLNEEKSFYDKMYQNLKNLDDGHCVVYGYDEIYDFMSDIDRKSSLLDVGCGAGHHSKDLSALGYDVTGIDISFNGLNQARKVSQAAGQNIDFTMGDIENLPFADKSFDVVFCSLILHHFPDRSRLLSEINRVCKNYFVTFEVNSYDPISFLRFNIINPTIGIHNITKNQRTVSPVKLEKEMSSLGFTDITTKYVDVHHNVGRYPDSFEARALGFYRKAASIFLPYKCRFNKFIMKARRGGNAS